MTYTFKLARRLAVSRTLGMLPALILFAACSGGDATAPDSSPAHPLTSGSQDDPRFRHIVPVTVRINPSRVTIETNQLIRFQAQGTTAAGDTIPAAVQWSANGGTVLSDGRFSAAATGTFMVVARSAEERQQERVDTAVVEVVRRQPMLASLAIAPGTTTLSPGLSQTFLVTGYLKDGRAVPVGVRWSATGGDIDAGGNYVAGDTAGTYQVIATNTRLTISDTALVIIGAPAPPPPPPATPPPPAPALEKVTLIPASATLAPSATRQFAAYGTLQGGDSVAVEVEFTATGGTVSREGLFTAGSSAGSYRVIATAAGLSDTSNLTINVPLSSGPGTGIPFGTFNMYGGGAAGPLSWSIPLSTGTEHFNLSTDFLAPEGALLRIASARKHNLKLLMNMTGGEHSRYKTNGVFDMAKWQAVMDGYDTPAIRAAVAAAVEDGTILGNSVMDEPHNVGTVGHLANSWGPAGTMTKARVDQMCAYVKNIFPTLPVGVVHDHAIFEPAASYKVCDFIVDQYAWVKTSGDITKFRDDALAMARRDGIGIIFSLNILGGGEHHWPRDPWNCPVAPATFPGGGSTGGRGPYAPTCRMTAAQLRNWGLSLGSVGCAFTLWRYEAGFVTKPENAAALKAIADKLGSLPAKSCRRAV